jgi:hypothetical protein
MKDNDKERKRFLTLLTGVAAYYEKTLPVTVIELYWQGLCQFELEDIEKAMWAHAQSTDEAGRWMPKVADLKQKLEGRTQDKASIAWAKVDQAVRMVGPHRDVVFDDPIIHRVLSDMGGWIWLNQQNDKEWPFVCHRFQQAYRGYLLLADLPKFPPLLTGIANAHNQLSGRPHEKPVLIGNHEDAAHVLELGQPGAALQITDQNRPAKTGQLEWKRA